MTGCFNEGRLLQACDLWAYDSNCQANHSELTLDMCTRSCGLCIHFGEETTVAFHTSATEYSSDWLTSTSLIEFESGDGMHVVHEFRFYKSCNCQYTVIFL